MFYFVLDSAATIYLSSKCIWLFQCSCFDKKKNQACAPPPNLSTAATINRPSLANGAWLVVAPPPLLHTVVGDYFWIHSRPAELTTITHSHWEYACLNTFFVSNVKKKISLPVQGRQHQIIQQKKCSPNVLELLSRHSGQDRFSSYLSAYAISITESPRAR